MSEAQRETDRRNYGIHRMMRAFSLANSTSEVVILRGDWPCHWIQFLVIPTMDSWWNLVLRFRLAWLSDRDVLCHF